MDIFLNTKSLSLGVGHILEGKKNKLKNKISTGNTEFHIQCITIK